MVDAPEAVTEAQAPASTAPLGVPARSIRAVANHVIAHADGVTDLGELDCCRCLESAGC